MHHASIHVVSVTDGYGNDKVFAPAITHALVKNQATAYCLVSGVDGRLMNTLHSTLPPTMNCVFRLSGEKRLVFTFIGVIVTGAISCILAVAFLAYQSLTNIFFFSTGPVIMGTPLTYPLSLCIAWYCTILLTNTAIGKQWAFALENSVAFCCNEELLSYWSQMKIKSCKKGYASRTCFTVLVLRERASGAIIRIVLFRLCDKMEMHSSLLCDAIHLATPKKFRFTAASVIVCLSKKTLGAAHKQALCELLHKSHFETCITPDGYIVASLSHHINVLPVYFTTYTEQGFDSATVVQIPLPETNSTLWWKPNKRPKSRFYYWSTV